MFLLKRSAELNFVVELESKGFSDIERTENDVFCASALQNTKPQLTKLLRESSDLTQMAKKAADSYYRHVVIS